MNDTVWFAYLIISTLFTGLNLYIANRVRKAQGKTWTQFLFDAMGEKATKKGSNITHYHKLKVGTVPDMECPICEGKSKITWGWTGVYYDMVCENGHDWKYRHRDKTGGK